jgi:hypothetical protein
MHVFHVEQASLMNDSPTSSAIRAEALAVLASPDEPRHAVGLAW